MRRLLLLLLFFSGGVHAAGVVQTNQNTCNGCLSTTVSASFSGLPSTANSIIVVVTGQGIFNNGNVTVADNQSGNTYVKVVRFETFSTGIANTSAVYWVKSVAAPSGTFTVTATFPVTLTTTASIGIIESTGTPFVDATGIGYDQGTAQTTLSATNGFANAGPSDLTVSGIQASGTITTPAGYTSVANAGSVGIAYKIDGSSVTDSAAWAITPATTGTVVGASFGATAPAAPHIVEAIPVYASGVATVTSTLFGVVAGDTILAPVDWQIGSAPSVSDGTSYTQDVWEQQSTTVGSGVFSLWNATAGTHAVVATVSAGGSGSLAAMEVAGLPTTNSVDVTAVANGSSTGPITGTTAALANTLDFALVSASTNNYLVTTDPSNWTGVFFGTGASGAAQYNPTPCIAALIPGALTALSPSCGTTASSAPWALGIATYKPASAPSIGSLGPPIYSNGHPIITNGHRLR